MTSPVDASRACDLSRESAKDYFGKVTCGLSLRRDTQQNTVTCKMFDVFNFPHNYFCNITIEVHLFIVQLFSPKKIQQHTG